MNVIDLKHRIQSSPAFVLDEDKVIDNLRPLQVLRQSTGCKILYSMKALPLASLLELIQGSVDGISVSSLFEARLAHEMLGELDGSIHLTSPGLRFDEFVELSQICTHISFNSLTQYQRLRDLPGNYSKGLRVNPKMSFASDVRYDPCRPHSKLGVDIALLQEALASDIEGLHIHTVFGCENFIPLQQTIERMLPILKQCKHLQWLNLGGGYRYDNIADFGLLIDLLNRLRNRLRTDIYLEPGKAVVSSAGYLLTTVVDRFMSDDRTVLVLDTSVNHLPEVFEYQIKPSLLEEDLAGGHVVVLAGSTCLAGDLFGDYRFLRIPEVGDKLIFSGVGAYSLIKAHRFNGYNLPDIYICKDEKLNLCKSYQYEDYRQQWF